MTAKIVKKKTTKAAKVKTAKPKTTPKARAKLKPKPKAQAKKLVSIEQEIKQAQKQGKLLIGSRTVFKGIKKGTVADVFYATNTPKTVIKDLDYYAKVSGIGVKKSNGDSAKLGESCGKPFKILLAAIKQ